MRKLTLISCLLVLIVLLSAYNPLAYVKYADLAQIVAASQLKMAKIVLFPLLD
jgi:hypothetical protein